MALHGPKVGLDPARRSDRRMALYPSGSYRKIKGEQL